MLVLIVSTTIAQAQERHFSTVRSSLKQAIEDSGPKPVVSKQFKRWEWFWERRVGTDGTLPPVQSYISAAQYHERAVKAEQTQTLAVWKELGPTAPDRMDGPLNWEGIGRVNCIAFSRQDSRLLWLGSASGGLWKSTNAATSWTEVRVPGLSVFGVSDIAVHPTNDRIIYVATGDANGASSTDVFGYPAFSYGVIKSVDRGVTWTRTGLQFALSSTATVARLWVNPQDPNVVVAATSTGIARSTDGGVTWSVRTQPINAKDLVQHPTNPNVLYASTFSFSGGALFMRSEDQGVTWQSVQGIPGACRIRLAVTPAAPDRVYAVASAVAPFALENVYISNDLGRSFQAQRRSQNLLGWSITGNDFDRGGQGWYDLAMAVSPTDPSLVFVGGVNIWVSFDNASTWRLASEQNGNAGLPRVHADQHFFAFQPVTNRLFSCHDGGLSFSDDEGLSWNDASAGLKIQQYYAMDMLKTNPTIFIAGSQDNSTYVASAAGGKHVIGGDGMECLIDQRNPSVMYGSIYYGTFFRSTNGFNSWQTISRANERGEQGAWVTPLIASSATQNTIFAGYQNVWKSSNRGDTWTRLGTLPGSQNALVRTLAVSPINDAHIFAGTSSAVYYSENSGGEWKQVRGVGGFVTDIEPHPTELGVAYVTYGAYNASVRIAEIRNGEAINLSGVGLPPVPVNTVVFQPASQPRLVVGTDVGVYFSEIGSGIWKPLGSEMPTCIISDLVFDAQHRLLRAATYGRGIWELDASACTATAPSISASPKDTVCFGDSIVLSAPAGFRSYTWSNGDTSRTIVVREVNQTGKYSVAIMDNLGCTAVSTTRDVVIARPPNKPILRTRGDTITSTPTGATSTLQWFFNGQPIQGATSRQHVATSSGAYTLVATGPTGCVVTSEPIDVIVTSVQPIVDASRISLFPNPAQRLVTLQITKGSSAIESVEIVDVSGTTTIRLSSEGGVGSMMIPVDQLPAGLYIVRVMTTEGLWQSTFIRQ
jgi:hypothetical protein